MSYCEYCGQQIQIGAKYCSYCGAPAPAQTQETVSTTNNYYYNYNTTPSGSTVVEGAGDYSLILVSLGSCSRSAAADLLEDTLGYSASEAAQLFSLLPAQAAQQLTYEQAQYLALAMTEYGMNVSVRNPNGYVTLDSSATSSVFGSNGSFLGKVAAVLGAITGISRMRKFRKLTDPRYYERSFRPANYRPEPPKHVRRPIQTGRPVAQPRPAQPPQPQRPDHMRGQQPARPQQTGRPQQTPGPQHSNAPAQRPGGQGMSHGRPDMGGGPGIRR